MSSKCPGCHDTNCLINQELFKTQLFCRLQLIQELDYPDPQKQQARDAVDFAAMHREILEMQEVCKQLQSPVVWSHNDLLSGNVMVPFEVRFSPAALPALVLIVRNRMLQLACNKVYLP